MTILTEIECRVVIKVGQISNSAWLVIQKITLLIVILEFESYQYFVQVHGNNILYIHINVKALFSLYTPKKKKYIYIYIYIERERERESERSNLHYWLLFLSFTTLMIPCKGQH